MTSHQHGHQSISRSVGSVRNAPMVAAAVNMASTFDEATGNHVSTIEQISHTMATRDHPLAHTISNLFDSTAWTYFILVTVFFTLYIHDLTVVLFPKELDTPVDVILIILFTVYMTEILLTCIIKKNICNFFFFMDILGILSIMLDISIFRQPRLSFNRDETERVLNILATYKPLRAVRFIRFLRAMRLIKVVRLFRYAGRQNRELLYDHELKPSKIALHLADVMTKKTIVIMLIFIICLPLLSTNPMKHPENLIELGLRSCAVPNGNQSCEENNGNIENYRPLEYNIEHYRKSLTNDVDFSVVKLNILNVDYFTTGTDVSKLRDWEMFEVFSHCGHSYALFNLKEQLRLEYGFSILLTTLTLLSLVISIWQFNRDTHYLVGVPVEKMTHVIRKLTSQIFSLSGTDEDRLRLGPDYEAHMIQTMVEKMSLLFHVRTDYGKYADDSDIFSLEKKLAPFTPNLEMIASTKRLASEGVDLVANPEVSNLDMVLKCPLVLEYFRLFLNSQMTAENLLFYEEVEKFKNNAKVSIDRLYKIYVVDGAPSQINISQRQLKSIRTDLESPSLSIFDQAQAETRDLMKTGSFHLFLESPYVHAYLKHKQQNAEEERKSQSVSVMDTDPSAIALLNKRSTHKKKERSTRMTSIGETTTTTTTTEIH